MNTPFDYEIIDAHIHPFLKPEHNSAWFGHPATTGELVRELKKVGISKACGSVIVSHEVTWEELKQLNREALELRDSYPDFFIPGIHVHGGFPRESCEELETMYAAGVRWIGELVPYLMKTGEFASPDMMEILALAQDLNMTVSLHSGEPLEETEKVLKALPRLKLVLAHPGDGANARRRFEFVARREQVSMDLSGIGLFRWNMLRSGIDICGSEKLLFGTDFPICSPGMNVYGVLTENLTESERKNIFSENFKRLIVN